MGRLVKRPWLSNAASGANTRHSPHLRPRPDPLPHRPHSLRRRQPHAAVAYPAERTPAPISRALAVVAVALTLALAAQAHSSNVALSLLLDWTPNPDHVGIYLAKAGGFFSRQGLTVAIHAPSD